MGSRRPIAEVILQPSRSVVAAARCGGRKGKASSTRILPGEPASSIGTRALMSVPSSLWRRRRSLALFLWDRER